MDLDSPAMLRRLVYGVVAGVGIYAVFAIATDARALRDHVGLVPGMVIAGACALSAVNYLIRFLKWHGYLHLLDIELRVDRSLLVFLAGLSMSVSPGKVGEVIKSALLKRSHNLSVARTAPVVLAERLTDVLGLFLLASVGVVAFQYGVLGFGIALLTLLALVALVQSEALVHRGLDIVEKLPWIGAYRPHLQRSYQSTKTLLQWRPLAAMTLLSAVAWSMEVLAFAWIIGHLGASAPLLMESCFIYATSTLAGALSLLPGGLGMTEASLTGLLMWTQLLDELTLALAATYVIRFTTLWFGVMVGVLSFLYLEWRQRSAIDDR